MAVLIPHDLAGLCALTQAFLGILECLLTEDRDALVEVFHREDDARPTRQSVDLRASVTQPSQELLHEADLVDDVQMT